MYKQQITDPTVSDHHFPYEVTSSYLTTSLSWSVGAHELHELLERVLSRVVVVSDGGMGEVRAGLLDDGGWGEVQGGSWGTGTSCWQTHKERRERSVMHIEPV